MEQINALEKTQISNIQYFKVVDVPAPQWFQEAVTGVDIADFEKDINSVCSKKDEMLKALEQQKRELLCKSKFAPVIKKEVISTKRACASNNSSKAFML